MKRYLNSPMSTKELHQSTYLAVKSTKQIPHLGNSTQIVQQKIGADRKIDRKKFDPSYYQQDNYLKDVKRSYNQLSPQTVISNGNTLKRALSGQSRYSTYKDQKDHYLNLANATESENYNLKQQNKFLLGKLKKMKEKQEQYKKSKQSQQKYRQLYERAMQQLQIVTEQRNAYKKTATQMKKIALLDVQKLQIKLNPLLIGVTQDESGSGSCDSKLPSQKCTQRLNKKFLRQNNIEINRIIN